MYSYFYGFHPCYFKIKDGCTRKLLRHTCIPISPHPHRLYYSRKVHIMGASGLAYGHVPRPRNSVK